MKKFEFGAVFYVYDIQENVFDNSYIGLVENTDELPELDEDLWMMSDYGLYELTESGRELYERWRYDASCGYDLCSGHCKGLAESIGSRDFDIFQYLIKDSEYSKKVENY